MSLRRVALGNALRQARQQAGLTQEGLVHLAGMDRSFYNELENAVHSTTVDRLCGIADVLGVRVTDLFADPAFDYRAR